VTKQKSTPEEPIKNEEPVEEIIPETTGDVSEGAEGSEKDPAALLAETQALADQYKDGWQRARADLDNFRKRTEREREQREIELKEIALVELLPVLDDFDLALGNIPERLQSEEWVAGILLIQKKLRGQLEKLGLEEIAAEGLPFNPAMHEAVMQAESDQHESGIIIDVLRKGYQIRNKVIRPALVRVAM